MSTLDRGPTAIASHFDHIEDPRVDRGKRDVDVISIAILAVICGADCWVAVVQFGKAKERLHELDRDAARDPPIRSHCR